MSDVISRQMAIDEIVTWLKDRMTDGKNGKPLTDRIKDLPSAQSELEDKIRAIGYTGKEGRIYIGGRLFAVRELPQ